MSVYACSDLHGQYKLYEQIQKFLKPDDIVYFLGDALDRGPQPWKLMKAILNNPQWIYLCGNHEDMMINTIIEYEDGCGANAFYDMAANGGAETIESWMQEGCWTEWKNVLYKLPYFETYINKDNITIYLTHAGFTPKANDEDGTLIMPSRYDCLWNRDHFTEAWDEFHFPDSVIVHGHTPIPYLLYNEKEKIDAWDDAGALYYCRDHKINLDCGACWIDSIVLLDLDTFDEYIFTI
jgi:serine/threonine protein phosphatase 1